MHALALTLPPLAANNASLAVFDIPRNRCQMPWLAFDR